MKMKVSLAILWGKIIHVHDSLHTLCNYLKMLCQILKLIGKTDITSHKNSKVERVHR